MLNYQPKIAVKSLITLSGIVGLLTSFAGSAVAAVLEAPEGFYRTYNGIPLGESGSLSFDGATLQYFQTEPLNGFSSDPGTYIEFGDSGNVSRLSLAGNAQLNSDRSGIINDAFASEFTDLGSNRVNARVESIIPTGSNTLTQIITLTSDTEPLGDLRLYSASTLGTSAVTGRPYSSGDILFASQGSVEENNLELSFYDPQTPLGTTRTGSYNGGQSLVNASFAGWGASPGRGLFPGPLSSFPAESREVSPSGTITGLTEVESPIVGNAYRADSDLDLPIGYLAWDIDPNATEATIVTQTTVIPSEEIGEQPSPEPPVVEEPTPEPPTPEPPVVEEPTPEPPTPEPPVVEEPTPEPPITSPSPQSVPEPSLTVGMLLFSVLSGGVLLKRKPNSNR